MAVNVSPLQKLLSGLPQPIIPQRNTEWDLHRYQEELLTFHTALLDYIRRLMGYLTAKNLIMEINIGGGDVGGGGASGGIFDWRYDTTSHRFQVRRYQSNGTVSAWEDVSTSYPVEVSKVVREVTFSTTTHKLEEDSVAAVYVLEKGSDTNNTLVDQAESCL